MRGKAPNTFLDWKLEREWRTFRGALRPKESLTTATGAAVVMPHGWTMTATSAFSLRLDVTPT
jgi:hypothetical protein